MFYLSSSDIVNFLDICQNLDYHWTGFSFVAYWQAMVVGLCCVVSLLQYVMLGLLSASTKGLSFDTN